MESPGGGNAEPRRPHPCRPSPPATEPTIFYKDWGPSDAQPIVFHHGWPLSADDWDNQMLFFLGKGYRVIAHDRRGHGRSSQTDGGNEMDTYAADVADLVDGARPQECDPRRPFDRRRRGRALCRAGRAGPGRQGGAAGRRAAGDGQEGSNPAGRRSRCSTAIARRSPPTAPSSTSISRPAPSMASTGRARRSARA